MKICIFCGASASVDPDVENEVKNLMEHFAKYKVELVYILSIIHSLIIL